MQYNTTSKSFRKYTYNITGIILAELNENFESLKWNDNTEYQYLSYE